MNVFPYKQLTLIPVATGLLFGAVLLFGQVVPDLINPHGPFVYVFLRLLLAMTLAGLYVVPAAIFRAALLLRTDPEIRDGTHFVVLVVGLIYVLLGLVVVVSVARLLAW